MSTRAMFAAATAFGVCFGHAPMAVALTPLSEDASLGEAPALASPYAVSPPSAFARPSDGELAADASVQQRGPRLQCVPFVRNETGVEIYGNANTWWQQAQGRYGRVRDPSEGAIMVMRGYRTDRRGHVAVVRHVVSDRIVIVDHANWMNGGEISRNVPVEDVSPNGDWSQVRVWNVLGAHWGGRVYNVRGFIIRGSEPNGAPQSGQSADASATPVG